MIVTKICCNRCKAELNGEGISAMFSKSGNALSLSIQAGMNVGSSGHYCGKGCLMLDLNEMIDMINSEQRAVNCKPSQLTVHSSLLAEVIHGSLE